MLSRTQRNSKAIRQAKSTARLNVLRHASADGLTKAQAAAAAQMTKAGVNTLLYKVLGTTAWPINGGSQ